MTYLKLTKLVGELCIILNSGNKFVYVPKDVTTYMIDDFEATDRLYGISPPYSLVTLETDLLAPINSMGLFRDCINLTSVSIDTSQTHNIDYIFDNCRSLTNVSAMDLSRISSTNSMFYGCSKLTSVPKFDLSCVTNTSSMFNGCFSLTNIPDFDLSQATNTRYMFCGCLNLTSVPDLDLSNVVNSIYMFSGCRNLTSVPKFNLSRAENVNSMFEGCLELTIIPHFDLSRATNTSYMFSHCKNLTKVPDFDLSRVKTCNHMFAYCTSLTNIPTFDLSEAINSKNMFIGCPINLINIGQLLEKFETTNIQSKYGEECLICQEQCNLIILPCQHPICQECFKEYYEKKLENYQISCPVRCQINILQSKHYRPLLT